MEERKVVHGILVGRPEGERERSLGELSVDMRIILKSMLKEWDGDTDWIFTAQDRDRWQVNVVLNLRVL